MLASAVGPNLTKLLHDQLDLFFACGLSEHLRQALMAIARNIPPLLKTIQGVSVDTTHDILIKTNTSSDRLLDLLSMILCGQPYKAIGAPSSLVRSDVSAFTRDLSSSQVSSLTLLLIILSMTRKDH